MAELDSLVVVLAAGAGTRMKSATPKVLHQVLGKPMLGRVLDAVGDSWGTRLVVVGHGGAAVTSYLRDEYPDVASVTQEQQIGTGDAVLCALRAAPVDKRTGASNEAVLVVAGDMPLLTPGALADLRDRHVQTRSAVTLLTAVVGDPAGYGRVVRSPDGQVRSVVEHRDADQDQLAIREINTSVYMFDRGVLETALGQLRPENSQGELYLTDVIDIAAKEGAPIGAVVAADPEEVAGINDLVQLAGAVRTLARRTSEALQRTGVTIDDPDTVWIEPGARVAAGAVIRRNSHIDADSEVESGAVIGPDTTLLGCRVGDGAAVLRSHCEGAEIGPECHVGPFTYLRPGTVLARGAKAGAYVEIKNSSVGTGSKVPHLSYVGDATIGSGSNIGAATVFVNYDGVEKHHTVVGDEVRIGSDTMLVAPVHVGDGAYTAAGSVVTEDVPAGAIAIGRARQRNVESWVLSKRAGTKAAEAADAALAVGPEPGHGSVRGVTG